MISLNSACLLIFTGRRPRIEAEGEGGSSAPKRKVPAKLQRSPFWGGVGGVAGRVSLSKGFEGSVDIVVAFIDGGVVFNESLSSVNEMLAVGSDPLRPTPNGS